MARGKNNNRIILTLPIGLIEIFKSTRNTEHHAYRVSQWRADLYFRGTRGFLKPASKTPL